MGALPTTGRLLGPKATRALGFAAYPLGFVTSAGKLLLLYKSLQVVGSAGPFGHGKFGLLPTNGGLKRPSSELDCTSPLKATPMPPRTTRRLENSRPAKAFGLHAKPSCGPKLRLLALYRLPPVRTLMLVKVLAPDPSTTVASLRFFAEIAPKYSQRTPAVTVRLDLTL